MGEDSFLKVASDIAYCHHERWDGRGYPRGLGKDDIPLSARLMSLADVYDALTSSRPYKPAFSHEQARRIIVFESGRRFDPAVVNAFLSREDAFVAARAGQLSVGSHA